MRKPNARQTAVDILLAVENEKAYSNIAVAKAFSECKLDLKDKSLAGAIVYGTLDRKITLDYIIGKYIKTSVDKLKPITKNALRIAIYQILFMDKIPESAAVNESVNIVKNSKERYNASFTNGVLRSYLRNPAEIPSGNDTESLSVRYSCPASIIESFEADYGIETTEKLLAESLKKPPIILRVNTLKTDSDSLIKELEKEGTVAQKCDFENTLMLDSSIDILKSDAYNKGLFHIEDLASQKVISKIELSENLRVLDICSAPGGKAFTMAQIMNNTGEIVALDLYEHRVNLIKSGAKRLGITNIKAGVSDAVKFNEKLGQFDVVLCDVPCSGLGVIRRKPEIKYKDIKDKDFKELCEIQEKILDNAQRYLKVGGKLIYSTCTLKNAENKERINAFLDKYTSFEVKYINEFMPHIDKTDGFFCAVMLKSR